MPNERYTARDGLHSVTRGTLILLLGTLGFVAANFVGRVLLVRELSNVEFDEFYIGLTLAGLLIALGQLGLPSAMARSIPYARSDAERRGIIRVGFRATIPLALGAGAALFLLAGPLAAQYGSPILAPALQFLAVAVSTAILASAIAAVFQGFEDVRPNTYFLQLLNPILFITFLELSQPFGYTGALVAYSAASSAALLGIYLYYRMRLPSQLPPGPWDRTVASRLLSFAAPLFLVGIFSYLAGSLDTLLLGFFHNSETGGYGADLSLARLTLVGLGALAYILLPVITRFARERDARGARMIYATATKWMILTSLPVFLVFVAYPAQSLTFVYKSSYAADALPLQLLVAGAFISTLIGPATSAQVSFGQTRALLYNTAIAAVADVVLGLWLIPPFGAVGAAVAWATASALVPALSVAELGWSHGVHPFLPHYVIPLVVTSVPIALILALFPGLSSLWLLPVAVLAIAGAFVLVVLLTRSIDDGDRMLLDAVERVLGRKLPGVRWLARRFRFTR